MNVRLVIFYSRHDNIGWSWRNRAKLLGLYCGNLRRPRCMIISPQAIAFLYLHDDFLLGGHNASRKLQHLETNSGIGARGVFRTLLARVDH